jgi:uncharacterized protein (TIGR02391 family)
MASFSQIEVEAIANALGDTELGLTGSEIGHILQTLNLQDPDPSYAKRHRLLSAFALDQNKRQTRGGILAFIRRAMAPARWLAKKHAYEPLRARLNEALALMGLIVEEDGTISAVEQLTTISAAEKRARDLRTDLVRRDVHPEVLAFCLPELLSENYFHAVLEAVKSVGDKLRTRTGLIDDGATLVARALGGDTPMLAINPRQTKSEQDEQKGFVTLVTGTFGMFRNPTAHEAKVRWEMTQQDAEDLLSLVSLIHRRLDRAVMPDRT